MKGVKSAYVTGENSPEMLKGVVKGDYDLVFFTPELLITSHRWRKVLCSDVYQQRLKAFVFDEAHCVKKW